MKILFLDIDGVLNTPGEWGRRPSVNAFNRDCVQRLNTLLEISDAKVVISSSWRYEYGVEEIKGMLAVNGFNHVDRVIDHTPLFSDPEHGKAQAARSFEISLWLKRHPEVTSFVALDDCRDFEGMFTRLVQTTGSVGLQDNDVLFAMLRFNASCDVEKYRLP